jgi:SpoVK/Ycf46/Vps4 family AAA+-type ATPase
LRPPLSEIWINQSMPDLSDLEALLRGACPIIVIETHEEPQVLELFNRIGTRVHQPIHHWTITGGIRELGRIAPQEPRHTDPTEMLTDIKQTRASSIYLLSDFHPYFQDPVHVRLMRDIALRQAEGDHTLVLISHRLDVPDELKRSATHFSLSMPDRDALREAVLDEAREWSRRSGGRNVRTNRVHLDRLIDNLAGLPIGEARRLARGAIEDDGAITEEDLPEVMKTKFELLGQDGVLSFEYDTSRFAEVGGLASLKRWLDLRKAVFTGKLNSAGLDRPKGMLLLGVQGCGKSLAAKAVAGAWGVPLLRLDFGALYNKFHGETERNLRESLKQAEMMAPCTLWIDEIEKGLGEGGGSDGGTSRRVLGTLLTWMAEEADGVFIVATANDIEPLPPELLRKGRLDEIFFVDLPDEQSRQTIFTIHLDKRELDSSSFDLPGLAEAADGFSGAEIEQAVVAGLYAAHAQGKRLDQQTLVDEMKTTRPLSVVMAEKIANLRAWAAERTVSAN